MTLQKITEKLNKSITIHSLCCVGVNHETIPDSEKTRGIFKFFDEKICKVIILIAQGQLCFS